MSELGFGVGYRPVHFHNFLAGEGQGHIDWVEVISENFMQVGGIASERLDWLIENYPVLMHGVSLSVAGTAPLDKLYLRHLKRLADRINPPILSDHLCWTKTAHQQLHDLLPFPYTEASLYHVARRVDQVQQKLGRQLTLENPTAYVASASDTMEEVEFLGRLAELTGCGILLDINNLYVNQCNLGIDPQPYFTQLPANAINQFHLAGHSLNGSIRIDTHDQPVCAGVWDLYHKALRAFPQTPTMIEWDDQIPDFSTLMEEVTKAKAISQEMNLTAHKPPPKQQPITGDKDVSPPPDLSTLKQWEASLAKHMTSGDPTEAASLITQIKSTPVPNQMGLNVYQQGYFLRIRDTLRDLFPTLFYIVEDVGFDHIVADYLQSVALTHYSLDHAGKDLEMLLRSGQTTFQPGVSLSLLADLAALDWALVKAYGALNAATLKPEYFSSLKPEDWEGLTFSVAPHVSILELTSNPLPIWEAAKQRAPEAPAPQRGDTTILVYRDQGQPNARLCEPFAAEIMQRFCRGASLQAIHTALSLSEDDAQRMIGFIAEWTHLDLICARDLQP
jgi:uncharacterized protein (UPF0276 family)